MKEISSLLIRLSNAHGPSGFEGPVRELMKQEFRRFDIELRTDGIGSLIAGDNNVRDIPNVMLSAHMDEVGLMVKYITDDGFIKFQTLGGWLDQALIGQKWQILTNKGTIYGITGIKTPHVMSSEEKNQMFKRASMFIDVGACDKDDAEQRLGIRPGDPIAPHNLAENLNDGQTMLGKAWDDRVGLAIMVGVIEGLQNQTLPCNVLAVSTVQEEVGLRGAQTSSHVVLPDICINLESGIAGDYPGISKDQSQEILGKGPSIFLHDSSMIPNTKLKNLVVDTAKQANIPLQFNVLEGYGQDGAQIQRSRTGVPTINISVPTRYLHSHNSMINLDDVNKTIELVIKLIQKLDQSTIEEIRRF